MGVTIPFMSWQCQGSKLSKSTILLVFLTLKTCQNISFSKQADLSLTAGFSGRQVLRACEKQAPWHLTCILHYICSCGIKNLFVGDNCRGGLHFWIYNGWKVSLILAPLHDQLNCHFSDVWRWLSDFLLSTSFSDNGKYLDHFTVLTKPEKVLICTIVLFQLWKMFNWKDAILLNLNGIMISILKTRFLQTLIRSWSMRWKN